MTTRIVAILTEFKFVDTVDNLEYIPYTFVNTYWKLFKTIFTIFRWFWLDFLEHREYFLNVFLSTSTHDEMKPLIGYPRRIWWNFKTKVFSSTFIFLNNFLFLCKLHLNILNYWRSCSLAFSSSLSLPFLRTLHFW